MCATSASTCSISRRSIRSGSTHRKGKNNSLTAGPDDPGSPYAIGSEEGGHDAIHPELGTLRGFRPAGRRPRASTAWRSRSTSPSSARPTIPGSRSIRNGSTGGRTARSSSPRTRRRNTRTSSTSTSTAAPIPALWYALRDIVLFWADKGVRIFRVDNPHTKPMPFWEWMIREVQDRYPGRDLPRRGLHPAEGDEAARQGRLHAVLFLLHLAQHQGGADRLSDRADADGMPPLPCGRTSSSTRRTSIPSTCRRAAAPGFQVRARAGGDACRQLRRL